MAEKDLLVKLKSLSKNFENDFNLNGVKNFVFGLNKLELFYIKRNIGNKDLPSSRILDVILDMSKYRFHGIDFHYSFQTSIKKEYCTLLYVNKAYDKINFGGIFNDCKDLFPIRNIKIAKAFKYNKSIGRMIFNYKEFNCHLEKDSCICHHYENFIDKNHGHVITGNLDIVKDYNLRCIMKRGSKYRLMTTNRRNLVKKHFSSDLDRFIYNVAVKYSFPLEAFNEWKYEIMKRFDKFKLTMDTDLTDLTLRDLKSAIHDIQKDFVITYVDKAANNFALVCKFFYSNTLENILMDDTGYNICNSATNEIENRIRAKYKRIGYNLTRINFPYIFLTPKFHKEPIKFRTITCGYNTYINKASKNLQLIIQNIIDNLKDPSIVNNSYDIVKFLSNKKIFSVYTFDFEDLFNNIDIQDLIRILLDVYHDFDLSTILSLDKYTYLLDLVIKENYINFNGKLFIKTKGLSQGGSASNALANIYLYYYEKNVENYKDCFNFRYIDDKAIFGSSPSYQLDLSYYPSYLKLNSTNNTRIKAQFLDLDIDIVENSFNSKIYNKKLSFNFDVLSLPHWNSSLHISVFRNVVLNSLTRNKRLTSNNYDRDNYIDYIFSSAIKQNYPYDFILSLIEKFKKSKKI